MARGKASRDRQQRRAQFWARVLAIFMVLILLLSTLYILVEYLAGVGG